MGEFSYADYRESKNLPPPAGLFARPAAPPPTSPAAPPPAPGLVTGPTCTLCDAQAGDVKGLIDHMTAAHKGMEVECPYCGRAFKSRSLRMHVPSCRSNPHRTKRARRSPGQPPQEAPPAPEPGYAAPEPAPAQAPVPAIAPPPPTVAAPAVVTLLSGLLAGTGTESVPVAMLPDVLAWAEATQALRDGLIAAQAGLPSPVANPPRPAASPNGTRP